MNGLGKARKNKNIFDTKIAFGICPQSDPSRNQNNKSPEKNYIGRPVRPTLQKTIRLQTTAHRTGNQAFNDRFDIDCLEIGRVNITPDPIKTATEKGKELACFK